MNLVKLKYIILCFPLLVGYIHTFAQRRTVDNLTYFDDRKLHFGFYLGLNTMDYRITNYNEVTDNPVFKGRPQLEIDALKHYDQNKKFAAEVYQISPGFTVGGVVNYRLDRDFDLRFTPGMSLGSRSFKYFIPIQADAYNVQGMDEKAYLTTPSAYVDIPIGIRYKGFRHYNSRPYVYLGAAYRYDLENKRISESVVHLNKDGEYAEIGLGIDSYLEYFRFTAEFRFSYGLNNLIRHDTNTEKPLPYYGYIFKELNSNIFTLILYFE